ncbi:hypothetical protein J2Z83_002131 [Virgibacillus natechei]|uniref:DUF4238 domain-containing protein n=1 Tax=Virgibacillus natechei TaxID=1216297 RepID=A0ABS4IGF9_9BACI|nr:DUF4238 domain-containing protein [Virgibacillus natechei]MBP1970023.1 hypothetical protein [Virgibacillus natechei]UZD13322.1 DUF4238 domain-containing protein [Virgibacillus natechei]
MNLPIKQHIIPKTYLKQFTSDDKNIWLFQKDTKHFREQSINKVPIIKDFYTVTDEENDGKKLYDFEYFLANDIEPLYQLYIEQLQRGKLLSELEKNHFAFFVSSQKLRSVSMKDKIIKEIERAFKYGEAGEWFDKTSIEQFTQHFYEDGKEITYEEFLEKSEGNLDEIPLDISKDCFVQFLPEKMKDFAETLASQNWSYLRAPKGRCFITSDNPVILDNEIGDSTFPFKGGIFPLTTQLALNINSLEEKFRVVGAKELRKINQQIIRNFDRFVFSHNEGILRSNIKKNSRLMEVTKYV